MKNNYTLHDILVDDMHMVVSIRPSVFMPKSDYMAQFMYDDSELVAVFTLNREKYYKFLFSHIISALYPQRVYILWHRKIPPETEYFDILKHEEFVRSTERFI